jgi:hypothetical protein
MLMHVRPILTFQKTSILNVFPVPKHHAMKAYNWSGGKALGLSVLDSDTLHVLLIIYTLQPFQPRASVAHWIIV